MLIAGVNTGRTRNGRALKDGAACLLRDGEVIVAVAEERLTRQKHDGGFARALPYCLSAVGALADDLDMVVVSSCADGAPEDGCDIGLPLDASRIRGMPSHHLSHAYAAFLTSPFAEAVIMVIDNEGNLIGEGHDSEFWRGRVERNSYYLGNGAEVTPLEAADDRLADTEIGPGEAYRDFTYFLGWHSYVHAGNTMGLAPYGHRDAFREIEVFRLASGQIHSAMENSHHAPAAGVVRLASACGVLCGPPRSPGQPPTPRHCDMAALIQRELEDALVYKAEALHQLTGLRKLCIGGGVALNCVANRRLLESTSFDHLYVCPAPGDSGQCLGNALYGWTKLAGQPRPTVRLSPYLGRRYSDAEVEAALAEFGSRVTCRRSSDVATDAAALIADDHVIGWFQGRSELGPRALGGRSILANPAQPAMRDYLNLVVKRREAFRPYAPSVLEDEVESYYDLPQPSPYMELTATAHADQRGRIPAVVHVDGSSRPQTVSQGDSPRFAELLRQYRNATGLPMVLNTSFNGAGEPIVESPSEAIDCFLRCGLDAIAIGDLIVHRGNGPRDPSFRRWAVRL